VLATARNYHTATLLKDGRVLIAGGLDSTGYNALSSAEIYDPATDTFAATGSMATVRETFNAVSLQNGRVLMVGGAGSGVLASAELYDPDSGTCVPTGSMAARRYRCTATMLTDGRVLVAGGRDSSPLGLRSLSLFTAFPSRFWHRPHHTLNCTDIRTIPCSSRPKSRR
jgi:hypothetical protein